MVLRWLHDCDKLAVMVTGIDPLLLTAACLRAGVVGAHSTMLVN